MMDREELLQQVADTYVESKRAREAFEDAVREAHKHPEIGYETLSGSAVDQDGQQLSVGAIRRIVHRQ